MSVLHRNGDPMVYSVLRIRFPINLEKTPLPHREVRGINKAIAPDQLPMLSQNISSSNPGVVLYTCCLRRSIPLRHYECHEILRAGTHWDHQGAFPGRRRAS